MLRSFPRFLLTLVITILFIPCGAVSIGQESQACGDGIIDSNEACDDGENNSMAPTTAGAACRESCLLAGCGDGICDLDEDNCVCAVDCPGTIAPAFAINNRATLAIDLGTGGSSPISGDGFRGFEDVQGFAYAASTDTYFGVDVATKQLIAIDAESGRTTVVGVTEFEQVNGLAFDPNSETLYGVDNNTQTLVTLDVQSAEGTVVGLTGYSDIHSLAFNRWTNTLYGCTRSGGLLIAIDTNTGEGSEIGDTGRKGIEGLVYDERRLRLFGTVGTNIVWIDTETGVSYAVEGATDAAILGLAYSEKDDVIQGTTRTRIVSILDGSSWAGSLGPLRVAGAFVFTNSTGEFYAVGGNALFRLGLDDGPGTRIGNLGIGRIWDVAFDPDTETLYGMSFYRTLVSIDRGTGNATVIGLVVGAAIRSITFDPNTHTLYGISVAAGLGVIDPVSAEFTAIGGDSYWESLAFDRNANILYAVDMAGRLAIVDTATGERSAWLGQVDSNTIAFDPASNKLYGFSSDSLCLEVLVPREVPPVTICNYNVRTVWAAAFDSGTQTLFAVDSGSENLIRIDMESRRGSIVGPIRFPGIESLAYNPHANVLYAVSSVEMLTKGGSHYHSDLISIDPNTGTGTALGFDIDIDLERLTGLAFDPATSTLYGASLWKLYTLNTMNGATKTVGHFGQSGRVRGLTFDTNSGNLLAVGHLPGEDVVKLFQANTSTAQLSEIRDSVSAGGLAFDPTRGAIYGARGYGVGRIDRPDGAERSVGVLGIGAVTGLARNDSTSSLYATDGRYLMELDPGDGGSRVLGDTDFRSIRALAFDQDQRVLFGSDTELGALIQINTETGYGNVIGEIGTSNVNALAFDSDRQVLVGSSPSGLVEIDPATGSGTLVGAEPSSSGATTPEIDSLGYAPPSGLLYGMDRISDTLHEIDPLTGQATSIGVAQSSEVFGLTYDSSADRLVAADASTSQLVAIDRTSGIFMPIRWNGLPSAKALAFDRRTGMLYGIEESGGRLYSLDVETGEGSFIGQTDGRVIRGLAFGTVTGVLFGSSISPRELLVIDTATGVVSSRGDLAFSVEGLAFDGMTLYGVDSESDQLVTIDPESGSAIAVGPIGFDDVRSLGFDHIGGALYGIDAITDSLLEVDRTSGAGTFIGTTTQSGIEGLAIAGGEFFCGDGVDNDCDGVADCADADCICAPGDGDGDGDVDLFDASLFVDCVSGAGMPHEPECSSFDFDGDFDVDFADLAGLQLAFGSQL
jgi:uncharacterized protein YjiK